MNIILSPQYLMPVFNPVVLIVDSANKNEPGFEYICDIYTGNTTTPRWARLKINADPYTGYGIFEDCGDIMRQLFNYDVGNSITGVTEASNSYRSMRLYAGEQYQYYFEFDDNYFSSGNVGFTSATNTHYFSVGDRVLIAQQSNATNSQYNGVHTITSVPNSYSFVIDVPFGSSTSAETGTTIYSDLRKTVFTGLTSTTGQYVFNGALQHQSFPNYTASTYDIGYTTAKFLTNIPNPYVVREDNYGWINVFNSSSTRFKYLVFDVKSTAGVTTRYTIANTLVTTPKVIKLGLFPWNVNNSGFGTIITASGTSSYSAYTWSNASAITSEILVFEIDDTCDSIYGNTELIFQDRLGSFVPFNFKLVKKENMQAERQQYTQYLGMYSSNRWTWNSYDRGQTTLNPSEQLNFTVTSDWISETYAEYLKELITSPVQFVNVGTGENSNLLYPIIVTDTTYEPKKRSYAKLINATLNYKFAFRNQIQTY